MSAIPPPAGGLDELFTRLEHILAPLYARLVLVRTADTAASAALVAEILDRRSGPARVVLHPSEPVPGPYQIPSGSTRTWTVRPAEEEPGSVEATARSMRLADTLVRDARDDLQVRTLWLPPSILSAACHLPLSADAVLVVDDWHRLVEDYLGTTGPVAGTLPLPADLDLLLVEAFRAFGEAHLLVVTSAPSPTLEDGADAVIDVRRVPGEPALLEVRILRDPTGVFSTNYFQLCLNGGGEQG
jgi:hypothetical protein